MIKKNKTYTYLSQQSKLFGEELFIKFSKNVDEDLSLSIKTQNLSDEINQYYKSISLCKKCSLGHTRNKFVFIYHLKLLLFNFLSANNFCLVF